MEKDPVYDSSSVAMFVLRVMKHGKKPLAYRLTYAMLERLREKTKQDPCVVFNTALENVKPNLEVKPRRVGGSTYQVPYEVKPERGLVLALSWILSSVRQNRSRSGLSSVRKMELEILDAFHSTGAAMRRRADVHRNAESNRAFIRYRVGRKKFGFKRQKRGFGRGKKRFLERA